MKKQKRAELLNVLNSVKPGLANQEMIEQSTCFAFSDGQVVTFNDEVAISHPIDVGFTGAVPAKEMLQLLDRMTDDDLVTIMATDEELKVKGRKSQAGIRLTKGIILPIDQIKVPKAQWTRLPDNFIAAVSICLRSAGEDMGKPALTCVHINENQVEACDNFQATRCDLDSPMELILLPARAAKVICRYDLKKVAVTENWAHFRTSKKAVISCRVHTNSYKYPPLDPLFLLEGGSNVMFPSRLSGMLSRADIFTGEDPHQEHVSIELSKEHGMKIRGEGPVGWFEETADIRYSGRSAAFRLNPTVLQTILKETRKALINESKILFTTESFSHVVALITS